MNQTPETKRIPFDSDFIHAARTPDGHIYVDVVRICRNLSLSAYQTGCQLQLLRTERPFMEGYRLMDPGIFDPRQPSHSLLADYMPLWLPRIKLTAASKKKHPDSEEKLIRYQLDARDAIRRAFTPDIQAFYGPGSYAADMDTLQRLLPAMIESNHLLFQLLNRRTDHSTSMDATRWSVRMLPKYHVLARYYQVPFRELCHNLILEFCKQNPQIDLNQIRMTYCLKQHISYCYTLDIIAQDERLRPRFEAMVDGLMDKYNLACPPSDSGASGGFPSMNHCLQTLFETMEDDCHEPG